MTTILRWLVTHHPKPAASEVKAFRDATGCGMHEAKKHLSTASTRELQIKINDEWVTIPTVEVQL